VTWVRLAFINAPIKQYVTFICSATNLVEDDTNGVQDVFVRDRQEGIRAEIHPQLIAL
jgi:hypothetical protein